MSWLKYRWFAFKTCIRFAFTVIDAKNFYHDLISLQNYCQHNFKILLCLYSFLYSIIKSFDVPSVVLISSKNGTIRFIDYIAEILTNKVTESLLMFVCLRFYRQSTLLRSCRADQLTYSHCSWVGLGLVSI